VNVSDNDTGAKTEGIAKAPTDGQLGVGNAKLIEHSARKELQSSLTPTPFASVGGTVTLVGRNKIASEHTQKERISVKEILTIILTTQMGSNQINIILRTRITFYQADIFHAITINHMCLPTTVVSFISV